LARNIKKFQSSLQRTSKTEHINNFTTLGLMSLVL